MSTILPTSQIGRDITPLLSPSPYLAKFRVARYAYVGAHTSDNRFGTPHCSIGYVLKGNAEFTSEKEHFHLGTGEVVYVPRGERYVSVWSGSPDIEYLSVHYVFNRGVPECDSSDVIRRFKLQKSGGWDDSTRARFESIYADYAIGGNAVLSAIGQFYMLYREIIESFTYEGLPAVDSPVQAAINYIEQNSADRLYIADLARLCHMSESRFFEAFHRFAGCSPIEYKNRCRIQQAVGLLADRENTIEHVSGLLNFSSPSYFRRIFKQVTGRNPGDGRYSL